MASTGGSHVDDDDGDDGPKTVSLTKKKEAER